MTGILTKLALTSASKNKIRTISTGIGIVLSTMLMTVVVILATSITSSMITSAIKKYGSWHIMSEELTAEQLYTIQSDVLIESVCFVQNKGYMRISSPVNLSKPYIHLANVSQNYTEYLNCNIIEGRLPQNIYEVAVTSQFVADYPEYGIGSTIKFEGGHRVAIDNGEILWQNAGYLNEDENIIYDGYTYTFTVVGLTESMPSIEYGFSPGYTIFTCSIENILENTKTYIRMNDLSASLKKITNYLSEDKIIYNTELLNYLGATDGESFQDIVTLLVTILIIIIGIAAFVLTINSLMTSSDERNKQFGVLFSIGMTRQQTLSMYLIEVLCTGILAIITGIAVGIGFAYLTFSSLSALIVSISYLDFSLNVSIDWLYLFTVILISFGILIIAALFASQKTLRGTAITKIKSNTDIKPSKTRKPTKNFRRSVEWDFVCSSFGRYRKKYLYVIISLSLSAILFVSAGMFGMYAENYIQEIMPTAEYDIQVTARVTFEESNKVYNSLSSLNEINDGELLYTIDAGYIPLENLNIDNDFANYADSRNLTEVAATYIFVSNQTFYAIADTMGLESNDILVYDNLIYYVGGEEQNYHLFKEDISQFTLLYMNTEQRSTYYQTGDMLNNSTTLYISAQRINSEDFSMELTWLNERSGVYLLIPLEKLFEFSDESPSTVLMFFCATNHESATEQIQSLAEERNWNLSITDIAETFEKERTTYALVEILAMIFTVLITVVAIINAFNSVSSNLLKRRHEFAVLQSIGLSTTSLYKIITFECLLLSAIVLAVTLGITPILSAVLSISFSVSHYVFFFPWQYLALVAGCLIFVFACSSIRPLLIIKRQNIITYIKGAND